MGESVRADPVDTVSSSRLISYLACPPGDLGRQTATEKGPSGHLQKVSRGRPGGAAHATERLGNLAGAPKRLIGVRRRGAKTNLKSGIIPMEPQGGADDMQGSKNQPEGQGAHRGATTAMSGASGSDPSGTSTGRPAGAVLHSVRAALGPARDS